MSKYTYASCVPLIGGETIAMENVFGSRPLYVMSYEAFGANDSQLMEHYNHSMPYQTLDNLSMYNSLILLVAHDEIKDFGREHLKKYLLPGGIIFDFKSILDTQK